jgi:hypothetical protein
MEGLMAEADLYEDDFIAWTEQQAEALRQAARHPSNLALDWEHLAEEIEDLGKSSRRALASHVSLIIEHLLKLQFSPAAEPRQGWMDTISHCRREIRISIITEPALRRYLPEIVEQVRPGATEDAVAGLRAYGEEAAVRQAQAHGGCYSLEQITTAWHPDRASRRD